MSSSQGKRSDMIATKWKSPSNIAIVKYWGKHGLQLPNNPSLSLTLSQAATVTQMALTGEKQDKGISMEFFFEGKPAPAFSERVQRFLDSLAQDYFPFLYRHHLRIETENSFPHSSGIASSASGMSALALCLCDIEASLNGVAPGTSAFFNKASLIARLGSGSACRSVFPMAAVWGQHPAVAGSSDEYAVGVAGEIDRIFHTFHDDILIISAKEKSVSSTAGHHLMVGNPYAEARYNQAFQRTEYLMDAMKSGDLEAFGKIAEDEALTLHALMMCSDPSYILMEEGSLSVIRKIRQFRKESGLPIYFTLDAGPNVHVLYPDSCKEAASAFIQSELKPYCVDGRIIHDMCGQGPEKLDTI
jgi:diphosphomevalonate decarboxylase